MPQPNLHIFLQLVKLGKITVYLNLCQEEMFQSLDLNFTTLKVM